MAATAVENIWYWTLFQEVLAMAVLAMAVLAMSVLRCRGVSGREIKANVFTGLLIFLILIGAVSTKVA
jgi:hypothetical protein